MPVTTQEALVSERLPSPEEVEAGVLAVLDRALDPDNELHHLFYGEPGESGVAPTPLREVASVYGDQALLLKDETEHTVRLDGKLEIVSAFKWRGGNMAVSNRLLTNPEIPGFTAASSGNHGQSVTAAATKYGKKSKVFVPSGINPIKESNINRLGGTVDKTSDNLAQAEAAATAAANSEQLAFIHPFEDDDVVAGQATIGVEMLDELLARARSGLIDLHKDPIVIALPVGGGGVLEGVSIVFKRARDMGLIGDNVIVAGILAENKATNTLCDGTATETGQKAQAIMNDKRYVQALHTVGMPMLGRSMMHLEQATGKRYEPAGALGACAQEFYPPGFTIVTAATGASVTAERFVEFIRQPGVYDQQAEATNATDDYLVGLSKNAGRVATQVWRG